MTIERPRALRGLASRDDVLLLAPYQLSTGELTLSAVHLTLTNGRTTTVNRIS